MSEAAARERAVVDETGAHTTSAPAPTAAEPADRPAFGPPAQPGEIGRLGKYRIAQELGRGGMGAVYLAFDERLQRKVALKVMLPKAASNATAKDRFLREARAAAQISSDYVVNIYEADEIDHVPYIALQYLKGYPLDEYLKKKGNLDVSQAVRIGREIALGLAAAHDLGLIHRDIKPGNIWLEAPNGRVKILDFGLAKPVHASDGPEITASGTIMGTPAYMAPEQGMGQPVDGRADLFSLGCLLYRLVTGRLPFDRPTIMAVLTAIATEHPDPVTSLNPNVPQQLADVIHRLLAKKPANRPPNAQAVADLLAALAQTNTDGAAPPIVYYAPAAVSVQQSNPFADIVDTATEVRPAAKPRAATPKATGAKKKPLPWLLIGSILGFLAVSVLAGVIIIKITNKDGTITEIKVPEGTKVEVNGKNVTPTPSPPSPGPPSPGVATPGLPWVPIPLGESPFDKLDPNAIPKEERFDWQPKELVAVIGSHARRHWRQVIAIAHSPDGKKVATSDAAEIIVWDVATQKPVRRFPALSNLHARLQFGVRDDLLWLLNPGIIKQWDISTDPPKELPTLAPPNFKEFIAHCVLESGKTVLSAVKDEGDQYDIGLMTVTPEGYVAGDRVKCKKGFNVLFPVVVVAEQADLLVYINPEGKVRRAKVKNTKLIEETELPIPPDVDLRLQSITPDGKKLVVRAEKQEQVWDLSQNPPKIVHRLPENLSHVHASVAISPDGKWLTTSYNDTALFRLDAEEPKFVAWLDTTGRDIGPVAFSPDSKKVVVGNSKGLVRFWDLSGAEAKELSPFDTATAFAQPTNHVISQWGRTTLDSKQARLMLLRLDRQPGDNPKLNQLWNLATSAPESLAILDEGAGVAWQLGQDRYLRRSGHLFRRKDAGFQQVGELFLKEPVAGNVAPDGRTLVAYSPYENPTQIEGWDLTTDAPKQKWTIPIKDALVDTGAWQVWFSTDNRWFATQAKAEKADGPWKLVLWRNTGSKPQVHATLPIGLPAWQYQAAFSPDGRYLAHTPTVAEEIVLLDLTGKEPREVGRYTDGLKMGHVSALSFHPDSKKLTWGSGRGVGLLDVATLKPIYDWQSPGPVHWLAWAADGRHLVTHNGNMTCYVLRMPESVVGKAPLAAIADPNRKAAEWVIAQGGYLQLQGDLNGIAFKAVADLPKNPFEIYLVHLNNPDVTDAGLVHFKELKSLGILVLHNSKVSDAGLVQLKEMTSIGQLTLGGTQVTDAGMLSLKELPNLNVLNLSNTQVSDAGLIPLKECKNLSQLWLGNTQVTDAGLVHLKEIDGLSYLMLANTKVTDAGMIHLKELKKLTILELLNTKVTDAGLEHLKELKNLKDVSLGKTKVTFKGLESLHTALPKCRIVHDGGVIEPK